MGRYSVFYLSLLLLVGRRRANGCRSGTMRYEDQGWGGAQERTGKAGKRGHAGKDQKVLGDMNRRGRGSAYASVNVAGMHNVEELIGIGDELRVVEFEPNK